MSTEGRCLCGKTSWRIEGAATWSCYCHCDDCRRACGAPVVAWFGVPLAQFQWTADRPQSYESSTGVFRHFCAGCGSPLGLEAAHYPEAMQLYAASLDAPERFAPQFHVNWQSRLSWLDFRDNLPKYEGRLLDQPAGLRRAGPEGA